MKDEVTVNEVISIGTENEIVIPIGNITSVFEELSNCVPVARMAWVNFDTPETEFDTKFIVKQVPAKIAGNLVPHMTSLSFQTKEFLQNVEGLHYNNMIIMCKYNRYDNTCKISFYTFTNEDMFADDWYVVPRKNKNV